jgi:DnaK suppressor protein
MKNRIATTLLDKIKQGCFGACEESDEPISPKRLVAMPWARLCIGCQSREEASQSHVFEEAA